MKGNRKKHWIQKCDTDEKNLPIPTQIVSNEEFAPPDQTDEQRLVEHRLIELADKSAKKLNISRRRFLASSGGMAAAFLALNSVFGDFFAVSANELFEPLARVYGIDVKAKMNAIPSDYMTRLKEKYRAAGAQPSNTQYGWIWQK